MPSITPEEWLANELNSKTKYQLIQLLEDYDKHVQSTINAKTLADFVDNYSWKE